MKVSDLVANKINRLKTGYVFTYDEFDIPVDKVDALKKTLSRLVAAGKVVRLSKGQFYKPGKTEFGLLQPPEYQIVKDLLEEKNVKVIHNSEYLILLCLCAIQTIFVFLRNEQIFRYIKGNQEDSPGTGTIRKNLSVWFQIERIGR
jgi:hypothetical protein